MIGLALAICHLFGDYVLQTSTMAAQKTQSWFWALMHAVFYTLPHAVLLTPLLLVTGRPLDWRYAVVLAVIGGTHAILDRYRLAKHIIWAANNFLPHRREDRYPWSEGKEHGGYNAALPAWLSTNLMFIVDNSVHLTINAAAVGWLLAF